MKTNTKTILRRVFVAVLVALMVAAMVPSAQEPVAGFSKERDYNGEFSDVKVGDWFYTAVTTAYEYGLLEGKGAGKFAPRDKISVAEIATIVARVNAKATGNEIRTFSDGQWYESYLRYVNSNVGGTTSILYGNSADRTATRAELGILFSRALPDAYYDSRNGAIVKQALASGTMMTDVKDVGSYYTDDIVRLYTSGLVNGMDEYGNYKPDTATTRAEVAAILMRLVEPDQRVTISWDVREQGQSDVLRGYADVDGLTKADLLKYTDTWTATWFGLEDQTMTKLKEIYKQLRSSGVITESMNEREKAHAYFKYLVANTKYGSIMVDANGNEVHRELDVVYEDHGERDASGYADGPLVYGRGICNGYTAAYNLMLAMEGIHTEGYRVNVTGWYDGEPDHVRTKAVLDGNAVYIDSTWGKFDCDKDLRW